MKQSNISQQKQSGVQNSIHQSNNKETNIILQNQNQNQIHNSNISHHSNIQQQSMKKSEVKASMRNERIDVVTGYPKNKVFMRYQIMNFFNFSNPFIYLLFSLLFLLLSFFFSMSETAFTCLNNII